MNFSIKIYPYEFIPYLKTWGEIKDDCIKTSEGIYDKGINFNLIDSHEDYARLIIQDIHQLRIGEPSQIVKTIKSEEISMVDESERNVSIRYVHNRRLEFINLDKVIYWELDFGVKGLYEINEEVLEEVKSRMLSEDLFMKYKKALNLNQYLITLETDLAVNYLDPIWVLALVFCRLVNGVAFVEHSFLDYFLAPGYYEISELEAICAASHD